MVFVRLCFDWGRSLVLIVTVFTTHASNLSVKFVPAFGLHGTRRKRRAPYLQRCAPLPQTQGRYA